MNLHAVKMYRIKQYYKITIFESLVILQIPI